MGRFSRAAVFAGATLAGCAAPPPAQHAAPPPPDPIDRQQVIEHREADPPPPPPDDRDFAKPPPSRSAITGRVTTNAGGPFGFLTVIARGNGVSRDARTDGDGRFEIHDLPAGAYTLVFQGERDNPRQSPPRLGSKEVTVTDGATEIVNVVLTPYVEPVDRGPCCKPYGAPPARRRVV